MPCTFSLIAYYSINYFISWPHIFIKKDQKTKGASIKRFTLRTSFKPRQVCKNKQTTNKQLVPTGYKPEQKLKYHPAKTRLPCENPVCPTCMLLRPHWLPWNYPQLPVTENSHSSPPSLSKEVTQHSSGYKQWPQRSSVLTQSRSRSEEKQLRNNWDCCACSVFPHTQGINMLK